jgi:cytochrome c-type biogenesis protein CcmH/NrfG
MIFISSHTTGIAVMFKHIFVSGLTLASIFFVTATNTHAELARDVNSLTIKNIDRVTTKQPTQNAPQRRQIASNSAKSMEYTKLGIAAQKQGDEDSALLYYYQAVKLDETNAVAFLGAGTLLGWTKDGIACVQAAAILFQTQGNQEGYDLAMAWLEQHGISN